MSISHETTKAIERHLRILGYSRGTVEWDGALAAARAHAERSCDGEAFPVTIRREDAQRLFDLATDSPLVCSGSFETDDVVVLRRLAALIGVDPAKATPDEFLRDFPHPYKRLTVRQDRGVVCEWIDEVGVVRADFEHGYRSRRRPETDAEWSTRVAEETGDAACKAGSFARPCGRPEGDPIHAAAREATEMGA